MRPPIIADNRGDITLFDSVDAAERYLEPVDIRNQEYELFDSEGTILCANISKDDRGVERIKLERDDSMSPDQSRLCRKLSAYLQELGLDRGANCSLSDLVQRVSDFAKER